MRQGEKSEVQDQMVILLSVRESWVREGGKYFNTALWVSIFFFLSFFMHYESQHSHWATADRLWNLHWCVICGSPYTISGQSSMLPTQSIPLGLAHRVSAGKATRGLLSWVSILIRVYFLLDERKHTWSPCLCVRHQAGAQGPWDSQDRRLCPLGKASWRYLAPQVLMFFPSTASSTREMW